MPQAQQLDSLRLGSLALPYTEDAPPLSGDPNLCGGKNMQVLSDGVLAARYGFAKIPNTETRYGIHAIEVLETMDPPAKRILFATAFDSATSQYKLLYVNLDAANPSWQLVPEIRDIQKSLKPHMMVAFRGRMFVKAFPGSSYDKLASVSISFDSSNNIIVDFWGIEPPTEPAHIVNPANWSLVSIPSPYTLTINFGWTYVYAWKSRTGHISCRSPLETNPAKQPSRVGAISGVTYCPEIKVRGHADTTRITKIVVYRTMDGGGTFYYVGEIDNPGDVETTFVDRYQKIGTSEEFRYPKPDTALDTSQVAPSTTSHYPPPSVAPPKKMFTDAPEECCNAAVHAGRIWYGIANYLYFSAYEEISEGVPEEAFPAGVRGNYFRLPYPVRNLVPVESGLLVFTSMATYALTGTDKETFYLRPLFGNIGIVEDRYAATVYNGACIWVSQDLKVMMFDGGEAVPLSGPIWKSLASARSFGGRISLATWMNPMSEWLVVGVGNDADPSKSRVFVLDFGMMKKAKRVFWYTPWELRSVFVYGGPARSTDERRRLMAVMKSDSASVLADYSFDGAALHDEIVTWNGSAYVTQQLAIPWSFRTSLVEIPAGNHLNTYAIGARVVAIDRVEYEFSRNGDDTTSVYVYLDDLFTDPIALNSKEVPARRGQSKGFRTMFSPINRVCSRAAIEISDTSNAAAHKQYSVNWVFHPGGGA